MNFNLIKILFCYTIQDSNISFELIIKKSLTCPSLNKYIYIYIQIVSILLKKNITIKKKKF